MVPEESLDFVRHFWAARAEYAQGQLGPAHQRAIAFARRHRLPWAEALLQVSRDCVQDPDAALRHLSTVQRDAPTEVAGLLHFVRASALQDLGNTDAAIEAYGEALRSPGFDTPGRVWYKLGGILRERGDQDAAIDAYRTALADPAYGGPGRAWYKLGCALREKGDYDAAIDAFRKAVADPALVHPGRAWNNLGNALREKGDTDGAIKAYRRALAVGAGSSGGTWYNLGNALREKGDHAAAVEAYLKALEDEDEAAGGASWIGLAVAYSSADRTEDAKAALAHILDDRDRYSPSVVQGAIAVRLLVDEGSDQESLSEVDRDLVDSGRSSPSALNSPESLILEKLEAGKQTTYDRYLDRPSSRETSSFAVLRGWSSALALLEGWDRIFRGGGYFIKWRDCGIVVDPGFDFLTNFHDAGYHGREIRAVLVTHNHSDHNADLQSIDDLMYELFKRRSDDRHGAAEPYLPLLDGDTTRTTQLSPQHAAHRFDVVVLDTAECDPSNRLASLHELPFEVEYFGVNHTADVEEAVGFRIDLLDDEGLAQCSIGFTGDTAYFDALPDRLAGCDLLVAHISQPDSRELKDPALTRQDHLGYRGLVRLIKQARPTATIVSEFWGGMADIRIDLSRGIRALAGTSAVLPASIGMRVRLPELQVECSACARPIAFCEAAVAPSSSAYGDLQYLCGGCRL